MQMVKHRGRGSQERSRTPRRSSVANLRVDGKVRALYYGKAWKRFCSFRVNAFPRLLIEVNPLVKGTGTVQEHIRWEEWVPTVWSRKCLGRGTTTLMGLKIALKR